MLTLNISKQKNGLGYVNVYDENADSVTLMVLVNVGSRYETKHESGLAHFVEHTFFKGSKKYPSSKAIGMAMENIGGSSNAFTSLDYTGYYIKVPKENFKKAVEIMADVIRNPLFPEAELKKERGVIIEEIRMYEDIPMRKVDQVFSTLMFGDHPLGRDIAGTIETVNSFGQKDSLAFTDKHYAPNSMLVVVAGGIEPKETNKLLDEVFSDLGESKENSFEKFEKELSEKSTLIQKELEQTHIVLGGYGVTRDYEKKYALKLGLAILSQGFGSILFQTIREKLGLAYYIHASHSGLAETGEWDVAMGVDNKRVEVAIEEVIKELNKFKKGEFNTEDIERGRNYMLGNLVTELESSDDLAYWFGVQQLLLEEVRSIEEVKDEIKKITKDDILEAWSLLIRENNLKIAAISPRNDLDLNKLIENIS